MAVLGTKYVVFCGCLLPRQGVFRACGRDRGREPRWQLSDRPLDPFGAHLSKTFGAPLDKFRIPHSEFRILTQFLITNSYNR